MHPFDSTVAALFETLIQELGCTLLVGCEIECYLLREDGEPWLPSDTQWRQFADSVSLEALKEEDGPGQYEFCLAPTQPMHAVEQLRALKTTLYGWAASHDAQCDFSPRVHEEQPSSALHLHIHLEDKEGQNIFTKDEDELSELFAYSIAGLLVLMSASMPLFAPDAQSYKRYREWEKYTPSKICWGGNNRTTPLRIPATEKPQQERHLEHRVSAAHVDPASAIAGILAGVLHGLREKRQPPACMFGDARERNHPELEDIPKSLEEALAFYEEGEALQALLQPEARSAIAALSASATSDAA